MSRLVRQSVDRLKGKKDPALQEISFKADFFIPTETQWVTAVEALNPKSSVINLALSLHVLCESLWLKLFKESRNFAT